MDLATGDPSRKHSTEKDFCFSRAPIPSPWIQKYKVAPLIRKAHLDEFGIISRSRKGRGKAAYFHREHCWSV